MSVRILTGDCRDVLRTLPDESVHCVVTSPPYFGLRDYGVAGQIGLEPTPDAYVAELVAVFREVRRVLRGDGTLWLNLGDSYASTTKGSGGTGTSGLMKDGREETQRIKTADASNSRAWFEPRQLDCGLPSKNLIGIPWRVAFALQADGWYLRQDIIWSKPNPMPESITDRCTKAHEYIFLLSKSARYYYDAEAIKDPIVRGDAGSTFTEGKTGIHQLGRARGRPDGAATFEKFGHNTSCGTPQDGLRNRRSVWTVDENEFEQFLTWKAAQQNAPDVWEVATQPYADAHFATFPPALIEPCIKAGCPIGGTCLDPFGGAGTTGLVADRLQRSAILIELNPAYATMGEHRVHDDAPLFAHVEAAQ